MACTTLLPAVALDDACMTVKKGQIHKLYLTRATADDELDDVGDDLEWGTRLDPDAVIPVSGAAPIREWSVIGSMPEGEVTEIALPLNGVYSSKGNTVITLRCYDLTAANLAAAIQYQDAGSTKQKAWFAFDDQIVGGNKGINGFLRMSPVVEEGSDTLAYIQIAFTFKGSLNGIELSPLPHFDSY